LPKGIIQAYFLYRS